MITLTLFIGKVLGMNDVLTGSKCRCCQLRTGFSRLPSAGVTSRDHSGRAAAIRHTDPEPQVSQSVDIVCLPLRHYLQIHPGMDLEGLGGGPPLWGGGRPA